MSETADDITTKRAASSDAEWMPVWADAER